MKLPQVGGEKVVKLLLSLGYKVDRQKGSHVHLKAKLPTGEHTITVPLHDELKPGTLNAILKDLVQRIGLSRNELISRLRRL